VGHGIGRGGVACYKHVAPPALGMGAIKHGLTGFGEKQFNHKDLIDLKDKVARIGMGFRLQNYRPTQIKTAKNMDGGKGI
jgi:hypothetical protein